jgi:dihydroorotase-like cyclic amidohydrolase
LFQSVQYYSSLTFTDELLKALDNPQQQPDFPLFCRKCFIKTGQMADIVLVDFQEAFQVNKWLESKQMLKFNTYSDGKCAFRAVYESLPTEVADNWENVNTFISDIASVAYTVSVG